MWGFFYSCIEDYNNDQEELIVVSESEERITQYAKEYLSKKGLDLSNWDNEYNCVEYKNYNYTVIYYIQKLKVV